MNIINDITTVNRVLNYGNGAARIKYIVLHYVGAVSTAKNNGTYFRSVYRGVSAHYFIDENDIVRVVNDLDIAWHCGTAGAYKHPYCRNSNSIGIEMCVKKDAKGQWYMEPETIRKAVELTAELMKKYNVPITNVLRHYDVTGKHCPEPWVRNPSDWTKFLNNVKSGDAGTTPTPTPTPDPSDVKPYRVRKSANDAASQIGAFNSLDSAKTLADTNAGYSVFDRNGKLIYSPGATTKTYTVRYGDSWWSIAAKQMGSGTKMTELAAYNGKTTASMLYPGNILRIPS